MKNLVYVTLLIAVTIVSALFFAQNDELIKINYFGKSFDLQLNWILILMLIIGFVLGILSTLSSLIAARLQLASANKRMRKLERALEDKQALLTREKH